MEQNELRDWEYRCIQEEAPWCQAACPLHVDVRAFLERLAAGELDAARKILERTLPLPGVLGRICDHPCEAACKRREAGDPLAVGDLERVCVSLGKPGPKPLILPSKGKKAAVLGSGLAALVCAWDLIRKGHAVTVYCPEAQPGGRLNALPPDILPPEALRREIERLTAMGVVLRLGHDFTTEFLGEVRTDHDAVFAEWGAPLCPTAREAVDPITLLNAAEDVFCGGWPCAGGPSAMAEAADGRRAASSMDRAMSGASLTASRDREGPFATRLFTSLEGVMPLPRIAPKAPGGYADAAEAAQEAARCLNCQCLECVKKCAYLARYKGYPKKYARQIYNNAAIVQGVRQANTLINSCSLCGLCTEVCPERFSMADLCLTARRDMVARGKMPPSAHEFALEDMAFNNGPGFALTRNQPQTDKSAYLFFPGCQLSSSHPHHVVSAYAYLRDHLFGWVGLMLRCCGVPALWAGREDLFAASTETLRREWQSMGEPQVVAACASCLALFRERLPELNAVSLWEAMAAFGFPEPAGVAPEGVVAVHDPCSLRRAPQVREAVRAALDHCGVAFEELPRGGELTECCGYGGLMAAVDPAMARTLAARKAAESPLPYVASCAMCRDRLAAEGKAARHALDFLFPGPDIDPAAKGPGFSERHERRARLKAELLREVFGEAPEQTAAPLRVTYAPGVAAAMEERRILTEDVEAVLARAEESGRKFVEKGSGRFLASLRPRKVTYWAEYARKGETLTVSRVWSHRMDVPGTSGEE